MRILIVDDDEFSLNALERCLVRMGHTPEIARDGQQALELLRHGELRLVITDWEMPVMNGIDLCRAIRGEDLSGYVYIIMLTGRNGAQQRREGLYAGADDFLVKPLDPEELLVCLRAAERILSLETRDVTLFALAKLAESRDPETGAHIERVQCYARVLAKQLATSDKYRDILDDEHVRLIYQTSPLHDLGKISIPDAVLLKPARLTPVEFAIMKTHAELGAQTLEAALERFPNVRFLQVARDIAANHHEHYDGSGYPRGLAGNAIPLCARIVAVADVYDALTSRRVYKPAIAHEDACRIISDERACHFDPDVVDAFLTTESQFVAIRERFRDVPSGPPQVVAAPRDDTSRTVRESDTSILIVDDDLAARDDIRHTLEAAGQRIIVADDGEEALQLAREQRPGVVVADWAMPKLDGIGLCRQLRAEAGTRPLHFLMLTVHSDKNRLTEAFEAGVDDFLGKPFVPEELLARVRAGVRSVRLQCERIRDNLSSLQLNSHLGDQNRQLERNASTDDLTELYNRRHAMMRLSEQWAAADHMARPISLIMADIDHFKRINDQWGHPTGDIVLKQVALLLKETCRSTDMICRIGGEEFLIILPAQTLAEAQICAERCRAAVAAHRFDVDERALKVTLSLGVASRSVGMAEFTDLLKSADNHLYDAKRLGRNRVGVPDEIVEPGANAASAAAETSQETCDPVNLGSLNRRCGGDRSFVCAVIEKFTACAADEMETMESAITANDSAILFRGAHNLKGVAGFIGAARLADHATLLEEAAGTENLSDLRSAIDEIRTEVDSVVRYLETHKELWNPTGRDSALR